MGLRFWSSLYWFKLDLEKDAPSPWWPWQWLWCTVKMAWVGRRHGLTNTRFVTCLLGSFQSSHPHKQIPIQLTSVYWCENNFLIFLLLFCFASNKTCVGQTMPVTNSCHFYCISLIKVHSTIEKKGDFSITDAASKRTVPSGRKYLGHHYH